MKVLSSIKRNAAKFLVLGAIAALSVGTGLALKPASTVAEGVNCDGNAVIYCGASSPSALQSKYNNGDGNNTAASIHHIYSYFGIGPNDIANLGGHDVEGYVTSGGNVYAGGKLVATGATTAGREYLSAGACGSGGGTRHEVDGTVFYTRAPSQSFCEPSLSAMVYMDSNGVFQFAVLHSCGNPVIAPPVTPPAPKVPNYEITKLVSVKGTDNYKSSVDGLAPGTHVEYKVTVKSTGDAPATNVVVKDNLPNGVQAVKGTLMRDGNNVPQSKENDFFTSGVTLDSLAPGDATSFKFEAVVGTDDMNPAKCTDETLDNEANINAPKLPKKSDHAKVGVKCQPQPKPQFSCTELTPFYNSRTEVTFHAKASASGGAKITKYVFDFGDNSKTVTVTTSDEKAKTTHTYTWTNTSQSKSYTANVTVYATGAKNTSVKCQAPVKIKPAPLAECTDLKMDSQEGRNVSVHAVVSTSNKNIKLNTVTYEWGDSSTPTTRNNLASVSHTYADTVDQATIVANVTFNQASKVKPSTCQLEVSFPTVPGTPPPSGTEVPPSELTNTGPGSVVGLFAGVTAIGAIAHRLYLKRHLQ